MEMRGRGREMMGGRMRERELLEGDEIVWMNLRGM